MARVLLFPSTRSAAATATASVHHEHGSTNQSKVKLLIESMQVLVWEDPAAIDAMIKYAQAVANARRRPPRN